MIGRSTVAEQSLEKLVKEISAKIADFSCVLFSCDLSGSLFYEKSIHKYYIEMVWSWY